jgi:putative transposase
MKRSRHSEEKILFALKQAEAGQAVSEVCRQMGISEATFYVWKKRYANWARSRCGSCGNCARRTPSSSDWWPI